MKRKQAVGTPDGKRNKISIGFSIELFDQIKFIADTQNISFNKVVVQLCKKALEDER